MAIDDCKIKVLSTFDVYDYAPHPPLTTPAYYLRGQAFILSPKGRGKGEGVV